MSSEKVTVTFHAVKNIKVENEEVVEIPYEKRHMEEIYKILDSKSGLDLKSKDIQDDLRRKRYSAIKALERIDDDNFCGIFWATYTGHEYRNLDIGTIQAGSVNLRPFYFEVYLSTGGTIYIATQYLGNFGGYTQLKDTIKPALIEEDFRPRIMSINTLDIDVTKARIGEISVQWAKGGVGPFAENSSGMRGVTTILGDSAGGGFAEMGSFSEASMLKKIIAGKRDEIKQDIFGLLGQKEILMIDEDEVENVSFLLVEGKRKRRYQIIDARSLATHFQVQVKKTPDGHPVYSEIRKAVDKLFGDTILKLAEDV